MKSRLELHEALVDILGSRNVYFQPPEKTEMKYPAIIYSKSDIKNGFANGKVYLQNHMFRVIVVDRDPDSEIVTKMSKFDTAKFDRSYIVDRLNHTVFTIFY